MLSLKNTKPAESNYALDELVIDSIIGIGSFVLIGGLAVLISGSAFVFLMIAIAPLAYITIGAWRGKSLGNPWLKALCLSAAAILFADTLGNARAALVAAGLTIPLAAIGIWLRRCGWLF